MLANLSVYVTFYAAYWQVKKVGLKRLERGDADSSGSTLRTMGIVLLVIAVVSLIGGAVYAFATNVAGTISGASYPW